MVLASAKQKRQHQEIFGKQVDNLAKTVEGLVSFQPTRYYPERGSFVEGFNNRVKVLKRRCYGIASANFSREGERSSADS